MDNSLLIQKQIKDNVEDLQNYVRDLKLWEEEMKRKDRQLSKDHSEEVLPPVRKPKLSNKSSTTKEEKKEISNKKIRSCDYKSWDKFDVEKACEELDNEDDKNKNIEENYEETAAQKEQCLKDKAFYEKELGNKHVKASKWDEAIKCYTKAIETYPRDPIFFANRALCYLKKKKYGLMEADCTESLKLNPTYVKAMLRRAAAREALGRIEDALYDLRNAIRLEPNNIQAHKDLLRLKNMSKKNNSSSDAKGAIKKMKEESSATKPSLLEGGNKYNENQNQANIRIEETTNEPGWEPCCVTVQPVFKPPHLRSKRSLKRIEIYDVSQNNAQHFKRKVVRPSESPSISTQSPTHVTTGRPTVGETSQPSVSPTPEITSRPAVGETSQPSVSPTPETSSRPTVGETYQPSVCPTPASTNRTTVGETSQPSVSPTPATTSRPTIRQTSQPSVSTVKPRSILTIATSVGDLPPPPTTSVQFHNAWASIKEDPHLCYRFIKQIPEENFPEIFKESLESHMFSNIIQTLASEFTAMDEPVLGYLLSLTRVKRFSTIALFMSPSDKFNLNKLFNYCLTKGECLPEDVAELRRIYEIN